MKKIAKLLALTMAIVMVVAMMAGCTAKAPKSTTAEPKVEEGAPAPDADTAEPAADEEPAEPAEPADTVTPESLMKAFDEKIHAAEGMKFDMTMAMDMNLAIMGEATEMSILLDMNTETDGANAHALVNMSGTSSDPEMEDTATQSEMYIMKEDGKMMSYTLTDGQWTKSKAGDAADASALDGIVFDDYSGFALEETEKEYIVSGTVSLKDALKSVPPEMAGSLEESLGMDLENAIADDADVNVVYTFDKETKDFISVQLDMADAMQKIMDATFASMMAGGIEGAAPAEDVAPAEDAAPAEEAAPTEDAAAAEGEEISAEDLAAMFAAMFKFEFPKFVITMQNVEFGAVEIVLPEEAANAVEVEESQAMSIDLGGEVIEEATAEAEQAAA